MSYKVLNTDGIRNTRIAVRITAPGGNNSVGIPWTQILSEVWSLRVSDAQRSETPGVDTTALADGSQYEFVFNLRLNVERSDVITELEASVLAETVAETTRLQNTYQFWGKAG